MLMIVKSLFLQPLGPALVLGLGAAGLMFWRWISAWSKTRAGVLETARTRRLPATLYARFRLAAALLILLAAAVLLALLRVMEARPVLSWVWQPLTVAGSVLEWRMDGWNWLTAALILLVTAATLLIRRSEDERRGGGSSSRLDRVGSSLESTLCLAAAAIIFTTSANIVTLASSWILFDAVLAWRLRPGEGVEPAARAWSLLSLAGVLLLLVLALLGEGGVRTALGAGSFDRWELAVLWLAALIRAGVYPLHFWLIGDGRLDRGGRLALGILAPLTGLWLLARLHAGAPPDWLHRPEWSSLGALALLGTALVAWTETDEDWRWRWIAINRAGLVVLAAYLAATSTPETLVWPVVTFGLGCTLLAIGQAVDTHFGWRFPVWLAVLALWGLPGTTGFLARWAVVYPTNSPLAVPIFGLIMLAEALFVAALWRAARGPEARVDSLQDAVPADSSSENQRSKSKLSMAGALLAVILLAGPLIIWGVSPATLARAIHWTPGELFPTLGLAVTQARKSVWIGLGLSAGVGVALGVLRARIFAGMFGWQRGIASIVSLEWLYRAIAFALDALASALQYFARLGEGEGYLGWLALGVLIVWVLLRG
jgi:hypothetical protein